MMHPTWQARRASLVIALAIPFALGIPAKALDGQADAEALAPTDATDYVELHRLAPGQVYDIAWSPDGETLAVAHGASVSLYATADPEAPPRVAGAPEAVVSRLVISADGRTLAAVVGFSDDTIRLWDLTTGEASSPLTGHTQTILDLAFSPDGGSVASASYDETVRLWDVSTGETIFTLEGHGDAVLSLAYSPDGRFLASGSDANDRSVRLWDTATGEELAATKLHARGVERIDVSHDGAMLASGGTEGSVWLWDVGDGTLTARSLLIGPGNSALYLLGLSPDSRTLASVGSGHSILLWDATSGEQYGSTTATLSGHTEEVTSADFSPDGATLATGSVDTSVRLWDVESGEELKTLEGHTGRVLRVAFHPDGAMLASASEDGSVRLWGEAGLP
jgi:WD40 repeat protein